MSMDRKRFAPLCAAVLAVALLPTTVVAEQGGGQIKQLMGDNFAGLQKILVALVTSNYQQVPDDAEVIREHASRLTRMVPASAEKEREQFLSFAYNLEGNARNLKVVVEQMIENDAKRGKRGARGALGTDYLRDVAAAHFGGMVTMCVACHNRFHPRIAK
jgi:hypothetical protein